MSKVAVASWAPRENSSAGFGARSTYCAVTLAIRSQDRFWIRPMLALLGAKLRLCAVEGPMLAGSTLTSKVAGVEPGVVPVRLTCSIRPAICTLVDLLNAN